MCHIVEEKTRPSRLFKKVHQ
ncbi:hypothetical protein LEMLEM_LOCUS15540 [Lemmus lemmus]